LPALSRLGPDAAIGAIGILLAGVLLVPLPDFALDMMLIGLLATALLTLFISFYARDSIEFSTFPSILLLVTVGRVTLTIAATRNILTGGSCGALVESLGSVLLGGNFVIGLVLFAILALAQYMVITGGTTRISEVTARFTLDALPGKQMSIDAELNSGLITEVEARKRRKAVQDESDFYGSMDGASKFVRGESMAAMAIIAVDIFGGVVIGVVQGGLPLEEALKRYCTLSVGLGLAVQISALLTSVASGILVTRISDDGDFSSSLGLQLLRRSKPLYMVAGLMCGLLLISGSPKIAVILVASAAAVAGRLLSADESPEAAPDSSAAAVAAPPLPPEEQALPFLRVELLRVELGYSLIALVGGERGGFMRHVDAMRRMLASELGLVLPPVHVKDNLDLPAQGYSINIKDNAVARGELQPHFILAVNNGKVRKVIPGQAAKDPAFGKPALWINPAIRAEAEAAGYTVADPVTVLTTHLSEVVRAHAHELLTRQQVQSLLDNVKKTHPAVVDELVPALLPIGEVQRVLQGLLRERVPIRDLSTILEALADAARTSKDPRVLLDRTRRSLGRTIVRLGAGSSGKLTAVTLAGPLEQRLISLLHPAADGPVLALPLPQAKALVESILASLRPGASGAVPVLLTSAELRLPLRELLSRVAPGTGVMSFEEMPRDADVEFSKEVAEPAQEAALSRTQ
jgi:flagellar biosynthesis protein FlhA